MRRVPRVARRPVGVGLGRRPRAELGDVGAADDHQPARRNFCTRYEVERRAIVGVAEKARAPVDRVALERAATRDPSRGTARRETVRRAARPSACRRARSKCSWMTAFSCGFRRSMRRIASSTSSRGETSPRRTASAWPVASRSPISVVRSIAASWQSLAPIERARTRAPALTPGDPSRHDGSTRASRWPVSRSSTTPLRQVAADARAAHRRGHHADGGRVLDRPAEREAPAGDPEAPRLRRPARSCAPRSRSTPSSASHGHRSEAARRRDGRAPDPHRAPDRHQGREARRSSDARRRTSTRSSERRRQAPYVSYK